MFCGGVSVFHCFLCLCPTGQDRHCVFMSYTGLYPSARNQETLHTSDQKCHHRMSFSSLKCIKCSCGWSFVLDTAGRIYYTPPNPVAGLMDGWVESNPLWKIWLRAWCVRPWCWCDSCGIIKWRGFGLRTFSTFSTFFTAQKIFLRLMFAII